MDGYRAQRIVAAALLVAAPLALPSYAGAGAEPTILPDLKRGFTGQLIRYHKAHPYSRHITKVTLTRYGSWLETDPMFPPSRPGVYIQNFSHGGAWVVDTEKRIYASLPPEDPEVEQTIAADELSNYGGIMATQPCVDATDSRLVRKTSGAQSWRCTYQGMEVEQFFDTRWGIVTREEWPDLTVTELRQLRAVDFGPDHFRPAKTYLEVSLQEFFQGYAPLPAYDSVQLDIPSHSGVHTTQGGL